MLECALRPIFNFFCNKEGGGNLSHLINIYLVYFFENVISQKPDFENASIKDVVSNLNSLKGIVKGNVNIIKVK